MSSSERTSVRTLLARDGFSELGDADRLLTELADLVGIAREDLLVGADRAADPDAALESLVRVARRDPAAVGSALRRVGATLWLLLGASSGFGDFYLRHPAELAHVRAGEALPTADELRAELLEAVEADAEGFAATGEERAWVALRVRYRRLLARIAAYDLGATDPVAVLADVAAALADAAGAALEASLCVARTRVASGGAGTGLFPRDQVAQARLAIIGMGKTGAREAQLRQRRRRHLRRRRHRRARR